MHSVVFVVFDGFQLLDLAGPVEVLRTATLIDETRAYRTIVATLDGRPVRSESGVEISADTSLQALSEVDTLVVVGGLGTRQATTDQDLLSQLRRVAERTPRIVSVCTGAVLLGAAGLLDGYRATTHWAVCDQLAQRYPDIDVSPDRIYVHDRDRWTSAGVTAGIDLFLALVEHDHGAEMAHKIAGWLVVFVRRPGGQSQFSAQLLAQPARSPSIDALQRWIPDHLTEDLSVGALARQAGMSPRNFARAFAAESGTTPAAYVETLRVEAARRLLETTDSTVEAVARAIGMPRAETLYRAFRRRVGTTPDRYRQHFGRRAS